MKDTEADMFSRQSTFEEVIGKACWQGEGGGGIMLTSLPIKLKFACLHACMGHNSEAQASIA